LSANQVLQFPSGVAGRWIIYNTTSGAFSITVSSAGGGTAVLAPQGYNVSIYSDGTNIRYTDDGLTNNFATLTVLGNTYLATTSGNVGIGTTSPSSKLEVSSANNTVTSTGTAGFGAFYAKGSGTNASYLFMGNATSGEQGRITTIDSGIITFSNTSSATERMRIDSSGNVGIGTTPSTKLSVAASNDGILTSGTAGNATSLYIAGNGNTAGSTSFDLYQDSSSNAVVYQRANGPLIFGTNSAERMRIDSSGNVGIGTTSPSTKLQVNGTVTATSFSGAGTGLTGTASSLSIGGNAATATSATSATNATNATTATNLSGGSVTATSGTFSSGVQGTTISAQGYGVRISSATGDTGGFLQFTNYAQNAQWSSISSTNGVLNLNATTTNTSNIAASGAITATGNITAYYSDDRLKTRLGGIDNALDKVSSLKGFYYEANETAQSLGYEPVREIGVSAQDVQAILPEIVAPAPIDPQYLTVRYERLVPLLIEAIKELTDRVKELEAK